MSKSENEQRICRLCFSIPKEKFHVITDVQIQMLQVIFPTTNINVFHSQLMCLNCEKSLEEIFLFKSAFLTLEDTILGAIESNGKEQIDLEKIIGIKDIPDHISNCGKVCRTCLRFSKSDAYRRLSQENDSLVKMLQKCFPEMNVFLMKDPVLCLACIATLEKWFRFITIDNVDIQLDVPRYTNTENDILTISDDDIPEDKNNDTPSSQSIQYISNETCNLIDLTENDGVNDNVIEFPKTRNRKTKKRASYLAAAKNLRDTAGEFVVSDTESTYNISESESASSEDEFIFSDKNKKGYKRARKPKKSCVNRARHRKENYKCSHCYKVTEGNNLERNILECSCLAKNSSSKSNTKRNDCREVNINNISVEKQNRQPYISHQPSPVPLVYVVVLNNVDKNVSLDIKMPQQTSNQIALNVVHSAEKSRISVNNLEHLGVTSRAQDVPKTGSELQSITNIAQKTSEKEVSEYNTIIDTSIFAATKSLPKPQSTPNKAQNSSLEVSEMIRLIPSKDSQSKVNEGGIPTLKESDVTLKLGHPSKEILKEIQNVEPPHNQVLQKPLCGSVTKEELALNVPKVVSNSSRQISNSNNSSVRTPETRVQSSELQSITNIAQKTSEKEVSEYNTIIDTSIFTATKSLPKPQSTANKAQNSSLEVSEMIRVIPSKDSQTKVNEGGIPTLKEPDVTLKLGHPSKEILKEIQNVEPPHNQVLQKPLCGSVTKEELALNVPKAVSNSSRQISNCNNSSVRTPETRVQSSKLQFITNIAQNTSQKEVSEYNTIIDTSIITGTKSLPKPQSIANKAQNSSLEVSEMIRLIPSKDSQSKVNEGGIPTLKEPNVTLNLSQPSKEILKEIQYVKVLHNQVLQKPISGSVTKGSDISSETNNLTSENTQRISNRILTYETTSRNFIPNENIRFFKCVHCEYNTRTEEYIEKHSWIHPEKKIGMDKNSKLRNFKKVVYCKKCLSFFPSMFTLQCHYYYCVNKNKPGGVLAMLGNKYFCFNCMFESSVENEAYNHNC